MHTLFNVAGILVLYPFPKVRYIPVRAAERLADVAVERRWMALTYTGTVFLLVPIILIALLR